MRRSVDINLNTTRLFETELRSAAVLTHDSERFVSLTQVLQHHTKLQCGKSVATSCVHQTVDAGTDDVKEHSDRRALALYENAAHEE